MSKILEKGEEGYGILFERDAGWIGIDLNPTMINEGVKLTPNEPLLVNCILQKWGVKNKNGRIYPKSVLVPQVELYQELINTNSSVSEANHPECVCASESMICTKEGWKRFEDISEDEEILTLNTTTNQIEIQQINKRIYEPYKGKMYKIKNKNTLDITVTPNHRLLLLSPKNEYIYVTAKELYDNKKSYLFNGKYKIVKEAVWNAPYNENYIIPAVKLTDLNNRLPNILKERYTEDLVIKSEDWFAFLGIYLADGHCGGTVCNVYKNDGYDVVITQKKPKTQKIIEELLDKLPLKYRTQNFEDGKKQYHIADARLYDYLFPLGNSHTKYIPFDIKQASSDLLKILFDWFMLGDGRSVNSKQLTWSKKESVFSTSKQLILDLKEIQLKINKSGNITEYLPKDRYIGNRLIKQENTHLQYNLNLSQTKHIYLDRRNVTIAEIDFDDYVACVNVPNGNFYVMVNGKSHWTGNSSVISLDNISHLITKMWWGKGEYENVLYGQLKILVTRGYINYGVASVIGDKIAFYLENKIRIGISSRGVGSLKTINGENLVQADFELIGFDLVSSPSTPGAYLFPDNNGISINNENYINQNGVLIKENNSKLLTATQNFLL